MPGYNPFPIYTQQTSVYTQYANITINPSFYGSITVGSPYDSAKNTTLTTKTEKHKMPCECPACKRDDILNGTLITEICFDCHTLLSPTFKFQILGDKNLVCDVCISANYIRCTACSKLHKKNDSKEVKLSDGTVTRVCSRCFTQYYKECFNCHFHFDRHDVMGFQDQTYCKHCYQKCFQTCPHCSAVLPTGKMTRKIRASYLVCDTCYSHYGPIGEYNSKPYSMVSGKQIIPLIGKPPHYFGIELETEVPSGIKEERGPKAQEVIDLLGEFAITKEDGSLGNGFEICTQPATREEHYRLWGKFFDNLPKNLVSYSSSGSRCGLHIHCSRKPLSLLTIAKVVVFVNRPSNQPNIEIVAGRKANTYSLYQAKKYGTVNKELSRNDRYEAVNLVNRDTIEFRIFKGTLSRPHLFKAIEFCDSVIQFCMTAQNSIIYCRDWKNYVDYVGLRSKDYPHLYAFLCAKFKKTETKLTKKYGFSTEITNSDGQI